jgi:alkaline phosphatase
VAPLWQAAVDAHVEVVLTGHDHSYERFAPQTADGTPSPDAPREFVVGTGGRSLYAFTRVAANSAVRVGSEFGFLRLTLDRGGYGWLFVTADGRVLDTGTGTCRA